MWRVSGAKGARARAQTQGMGGAAEAAREAGHPKRHMGGLQWADVRAC